MSMGIMKVKGNKDIMKCKKQLVSSKKNLLECSIWFQMHAQLSECFITHFQERMSSSWTQISKWNATSASEIFCPFIKRKLLKVEQSTGREINGRWRSMPYEEKEGSNFFIRVQDVSRSIVLITQCSNSLLSFCTDGNIFLLATKFKAGESRKGRWPYFPDSSLFLLFFLVH